LCSVKSLESQSPSRVSQTVIDIQQLVNKNKNKITVVWIPKHVGLTGNEKTDLIAKIATSTESIQTFHSHDIKQEITNIDKYVNIKWQEKYTAASSGSMYRDIEPTVSKNIKLKNANQQKEVLITHLGLEKCRLNKDVYDIKKHDDGQCMNCMVPETIKHVLLECSTNGFREQLLHLCQSSVIHPALNTILSHGSLIDLVYRLMTSLDRPI